MSRVQAEPPAPSEADYGFETKSPSNGHNGNGAHAADSADIEAALADLTRDSDSTRIAAVLSLIDATHPDALTRRTWHERVKQATGKPFSVLETASRSLVPQR